jgi:Glycosyltransferase family 92
VLVDYGLLTAADTKEHPQLARQGQAGAHCIDNYASESDWMIMLDVDEFVFPLFHPTVPAFLEAEISDDTSVVVPPSIVVACCAFCVRTGATRWLCASITSRTAGRVGCQVEDHPPSPHYFLAL